MAVELPARRPRDLPAPSSIAVAGYAPALPGRRTARPADEDAAWPKGIQRLFEILPGALALFLISSLVWGYFWLPTQLAIGLLIFDFYWLWKSWTIAYHVMKGVRLMRRAKAMDWRAEYRLATERGVPVLPWDDVRHVVIIPNYKESLEKLRMTLGVMAQATGARDNIIPVLAMEDGEPGARQKASALAREFTADFYSLLVTYHPGNIPGEVRGKSSNEAWAARCAVDELISRRGMDIDNLTVTSCDADTLFPEAYFDCLTYNFATDPARYRRFWQAPIFFYNNIWQVPAPLRIPNALSGLIHLSRLSRKRKVLFSQSTYTLSMRMAHDVGYWDTDIIPEDWHMFLKCFYRLGGNVDVKPIHLPIGNDGALSHTQKQTYINQYLQVQRWAWGAADTPYVLNHVFNRHDIPLQKRFLRFWYMFDNHLSWSTHWFFITLGGLIPSLYGHFTGVMLVPEWFYLDEIIGPTFLPGWLTITTFILSPCLVCYFIIIRADRSLRPPAPASLSTTMRALAYVHWLLIPPITFLFSALPALDSQIRLMLGRRMEYRVTEKV